MEIPTLYEVKKSKKDDRLRNIRLEFCRAFKRALADEDAIAGYTLVTWDSKTVTRTSYLCGTDSAISSRLMPTFIKDVLTQHVAVSLSKEEN